MEKFSEWTTWMKNTRDLSLVSVLDSPSLKRKHWAASLRQDDHRPAIVSTRVMNEDRWNLSFRLFRLKIRTSAEQTCLVRAKSTINYWTSLFLSDFIDWSVNKIFNIFLDISNGFLFNSFLPRVFRVASMIALLFPHPILLRKFSFSKRKSIFHV